MEATLPPLDAITDAWSAWQALIGVTKIETEEEYDRVAAILDMVLDATRDAPGHPLEGALLYLGDLIKAYDNVHYNF